LLDQAIVKLLIALRDQLASCVGCGCLSLKSCKLYNPEDIARRRGSGARYLLGDSSRAVLAEEIPDKQKA
jgi:MerR family redox-sensitive transcriptional activator SoxR